MRRYSLQTEARLEKEALEERLRAGDAKLTVARRERNALLAALRDMQRTGRAGTGESQSPTSAGLAPPETASTDARGGVFSVADAGVTSASDERENVAVSVVGATRQRGTVGDAVHAGDRRGYGLVAVADGCNSRAGNSDTREGDFGEQAKGKACVAVDVDGGGGGVNGGGGHEDDAGSKKSASLAARLEMLAVQTRELLAEDSSWSSDDSES